MSRERGINKYNQYLTTALSVLLLQQKKGVNSHLVHIAGRILLATVDSGLQLDADVKWI